MFRCRKEPEEFHKEYNQQRRAEAFFSKFKRRFGPVKSRIGTVRRREVWMRSIILNMLVVVSEEIGDELAVAG